LELQRNGIVKAVLRKKTPKPHRLKDRENILVVAKVGGAGWRGGWKGWAKWVKGVKGTNFQL